MADNQTTRIKVKKTSRPVGAPEWAMRQGYALAGRHVADFDARAALAADIAEALYRCAAPIMGGPGACCAACNGSGREPAKEKAHAG